MLVFLPSVANVFIPSLNSKLGDAANASCQLVRFAGICP